jgi:hypothetical protein
MDKVVKKAIKTGYGLGLLSLAEGKKVAGKVKKELGLNEKESLKLARELVKGSEKASKDVMKIAGKHFEGALTKTGLVKKGELKKVGKTLGSRVKAKIKSCKPCKSKCCGPKKKTAKKKVVKRKAVKRKVKKRK